jgi:hypothetical protein
MGYRYYRPWWIVKGLSVVWSLEISCPEVVINSYLESGEGCLKNYVADEVGVSHSKDD